MTRIPARNVWTALTCLVIAIALPITTMVILRSFMSRFLTRDNAGILFDQFQLALDHGNMVRDPIAAADVAATAYWQKTQAICLDGWGHQMRISATIENNNCELTLLSAGKDGVFGTADDMTVQHSFDVSTKKPTTAPSSHL